MLAWMDLEMTGLEPERHVIVEIATLITDDELEVIAEGPELVIHQTPAAMATMDDYVREMHTRSGLLEKIAASTVSAAQAYEATLGFLRTHIPEARSVPLCGNSIGTDRRFLAKWFPEIEEYLHYRSVDVSTHQRAGQTLAARGAGQRAQEGPWPSRPRRHPREPRRAALLPGSPVREIASHVSQRLHCVPTWAGL